MDTLAEVLDRIHAREHDDDVWGEGHEAGYAKAREDILALLAGQAKAKATAARKVAAVRAWAETET